MSREAFTRRLSAGLPRYLLVTLLVTGSVLATGAVSAAQLSLSWIDNAGGSATFKVERKTTGAFAQIATTAAGVTSYTDTTVAAGTSYCYRVRASNSAGDSGYSNEACGTAALPASFDLTVVKAGAGSGSVVSNPAGINCGGDCFESYAAGAVVTLTAAASSGSLFSGWSGGGCSGTAPCVMTGNTAVTVTATFSQASQGDIAAPTASITSPAGGASVSGSVSVTASATDNVGVTRVELWVDGALALTDTTSPWSFAWASTSAPNGSHSLVARAHDAAGNVGSSAAISVTVNNVTPDTSAPTASITSPAGGASVSGSVSVTASASDNIGVTRVELWVDGTLAATDTTNPWSFAWASTSVPNGSHSLVARAHDAAGNVGSSAAISVTVNNVTPDSTGPAGRLHDFNGDGKGDVLWRHSTGLVYVWLMDGAGAVTGQGTIGTTSNDWTLEGVGDFNGDGGDDILWRHSSGLVHIWFMSGLSRLGGATVRTVASDWRVEAVGDFNGDGRADVLWRHLSGVTHIWFMNGAAITGEGSPGGPSTEWTIQDVGDFNADGRDDILWRHSSGLAYIWLMNGLVMIASGSPGTMPNDWSVQRVEDFDGDGRADILWWNTSGATSVWLVDGTQTSTAGSPGSAPSSWTLEAAGKRTGGGEILWRQPDGRLQRWAIAGTSLVGQTTLGTVATDWIVY